MFTCVFIFAVFQFIEDPEIHKPITLPEPYLSQHIFLRRKSALTSFCLVSKSVALETGFGSLIKKPHKTIRCVLLSQNSEGSSNQVEPSDCESKPIAASTQISPNLLKSDDDFIVRAHKDVLRADAVFYIGDEECCVICLIELVDPEEKAVEVSKTTCNHFFHSSCIERWMIDHERCPLCNSFFSG